MKDLRVSVIVPTYNGERWIEEAVHGALDQTLPPAEIVVIDDGSSDGTPDLVARFGSPVRLVRQARGGIGAARNRGVAEASGTYLAFLDHDDRWLENKLELQVALAEADPDLAVVYTDATEFDHQGIVHDSYVDLFPRLRRTDDLFRSMVSYHIPLMSTVLLRADFLRRHQLSFIEQTSGVDDLGLLLEIAANGGKFGFIDEALCWRRLHEANLSKVHYHRFAQRIVLYRTLLRRLEHAAGSHREDLARGLRDAHFRVGECHWDRADMVQARHHFLGAANADLPGLRAFALFLAARLLPCAAIQVLRQGKQSLFTSASAVKKTRGQRERAEQLSAS